MLFEERAPPLDVFVFDLRQIVEDGASLWIRLHARQRAIEPRGVHLVEVVLAPGGFDRHSSMLSRVGPFLAKEPEGSCVWLLSSK
jgi:hypothetical protein